MRKRYYNAVNDLEQSKQLLCQIAYQFKLYDCPISISAINQRFADEWRREYLYELYTFYIRVESKINTLEDILLK